MRYVENVLKMMKFVTASQGYEWDVKKSIECDCRCWQYKDLIAKLVITKKDDLCKKWYDTFYCLRIDNEATGEIYILPIKDINFKNTYNNVKSALRHEKYWQ